MVLSTEWLQNLEENFCLEEEQRVEKDFRLKLIMTKLVSLKKSSHFQIVLKNRVVSNDLFTIYRVKNFIKKTNNTKKLYISFVM